MQNTLEDCSQFARFFRVFFFFFSGQPRFSGLDQLVAFHGLPPGWVSPCQTRLSNFNGWFYGQPKNMKKSGQVCYGDYLLALEKLE